MLMLIYPPCNRAYHIWRSSGKFFGHDRAVYISVMVGTWAAAILDCMKTLPEFLQKALRLDASGRGWRQNICPLFDKNLGWLLPAFAGLCVGLIIHLIKEEKR